MRRRRNNARERYSSSNERKKRLENFERDTQALIADVMSDKMELKAYLQSLDELLERLGGLRAVFPYGEEEYKGYYHTHLSDAARYADAKLAKEREADVIASLAMLDFMKLPTPIQYDAVWRRCQLLYAETMVSCGTPRLPADSNVVPLELYRLVKLGRLDRSDARFARREL